MPEQDPQLIERLDFEYSPSRHSKRFDSPSEVERFHVAFVEREHKSVLADPGIVHDLNVKYGASEDETLDIYSTPNTAPDAPIFVFVHGGYWQILSKDCYGNCVRPLVTKGGYRVFVANYSLCPKVTLSEIVAQTRVLLDFTLEYASTHNSRFVSISGHSAGAHLVMAALQPKTRKFPLLRKVYLISGVFDLAELRFAPAVNKDNILSISDENVRELSPSSQDFSHLSGSGVEFKFFVGEHESQTFKRQSKNMQRVLVETSGCLSSLQILPQIDHFDIVENLSSETYVISKAIIEDAS